MTLTVDTSSTLTSSITLRSTDPGVDVAAITESTVNMTVSQEQPSDIENGASAAAQDPMAKFDGANTSGSSVDSGAGPTPKVSAVNSSAASSARPAFERKLSISEQASAGSTGKFRAPSYLRWIEFPFRVKNIQTHQYLEEATGHVMDVAARGPINQTGSFVGAAMIRLAAEQAGGPNEVIYGIKASSVLTVGSMIVGITAGITMPFVGALVDHTDHRKAMGSVSALIIVLAVGFQLMLNADTWFAIWVLETIGGYFLIMHQVCTMAYLPDLTHDLTEMGHYTARFMMNQYFVQGIFTSIVIAVSFTRQTTNLQTALLAAGLSTGIGAICFGYAWIFLFRRRPRLREIPQGHNIFTTGFKQLLVTSRVVFGEYKALKWFMIALLFSPEAGAGVILAIAVTFLTFFVNMDVKEIAVASITMLFSNIPGAMISKRMCRWINPLNSFRCAEVMFAIVNALIAGTVTGSTQRDKNLVYFYASLMGVAFGWMFPSQRTLAVALIPKGQETEIMGLISFFGQIVGWLPVFVFTAMNENGVSMRWGLASVSFFLITSCLITFFCGNYEDALELVAHTSDEYLDDYRRKSGLESRESFADNKASEANSKGEDGKVRGTEGTEITS